MVLAPALATARSGLPSPLKSAIATDQGVMPTAKVCAGWKVPSPLPSSTETVLARELASARSCTPSLLKSPTATDTGVAPDTKSLWAMNETVWAEAGLGSADEKRIVAATSRDSQAEFLVMSPSPMLPPVASADQHDTGRVDKSSGETVSRQGEMPEILPGVTVTVPIR